MFSKIEDWLFDDTDETRTSARSAMRTTEMNKLVIDLVKTCQRKNTEISRLTAALKDREREIEFLRGMLTQLAKD